MRSRLLLFCSLLLIASLSGGGHLVAQVEDAAPSLSRIIAELTEGIEDEEERSVLMERIEQLYRYPLDLNRATDRELAEVPHFDDFFIRNLLLLRSQKGGFITLYDLREVPGAPMDKLPLLEPLLRVGDRLSGSSSAPFRQQLYLGMDTEFPLIPKGERAFLPGLGLRYQGERTGAYRWGFLMGKDKREPFLPLRAGFVDHISLSYERQLGPEARLLLGDYQVTAGLGLLMGQSLSYFSRLEQTGKPTSVRQGGLRSHLSFREYNFLRGGAWEQRWSEELLSQLFYGLEHLDARIEQGAIQTLYRTGMHRRGNELKYRKSAQLHTMGVHLLWRIEPIEVGLLSLYQFYYSPREQRRLQPPRPFRTQAHGNGVWHSSVHFKLFPTYQLQLFGEALLSRRDQALAILGTSYQADYFGSLTLALRYLGKDAVTAYGRPDARYSNARDERGMQVVWRGELPFPYWSATAYLDLFQRLSHLRTPDSSLGYLLSLKADRSTYQGYLYFRGRLYQPKGKPRHTSLRCSVLQSLGDGRWTVRAGGQVGWLGAGSTDYTLYVRLRHELSDGTLRIDVGGQYFRSITRPIRSDNAYMPYRYYAPFLRGHGFRLQASLKWHPCQSMALYSRISHTLYVPNAKRPTTPLPTLFDLGTILKL